MGKRVRVQRRGKGGSTFRASSHKRIAPSKYSSLSKDEISTGVKGTVKKLLHESGRGAPLAIITLENTGSYYSVIPEGVYEKQEINYRAVLQWFARYCEVMKPRTLKEGYIEYLETLGVIGWNENTKMIEWKGEVPSF